MEPQQKEHLRILVQNIGNSPTSKKFIVKIGQTFHFKINLPSNANETLQKRWSRDLILGATIKFLSKCHPSEVNNGSRKIAAKIYRTIKHASIHSPNLLDQFESIGKSYHNYQPEGIQEQQDSQISQVRQEIESLATPIPSESIFNPEPTGVTYAMIGKSFSGKTTFIVNELNKLTEQQLKAYNAIIFFTESSHAQPLRDLAPHVKTKTILIDRFCPKVLQALKRVNDATKNQFKFLVIFDDIISLRGPLITKCILTLRNANISTVISIQYEKLLNPAQRSSVHNMFIFNLRSESWEFLLKGFLLGNVKELLRKSVYDEKSVVRVSQLLRETMDPYILYYNQREDKIALWIKKS